MASWSELLSTLHAQNDPNWLNKKMWVKQERQVLVPASQPTPQPPSTILKLIYSKSDPHTPFIGWSVSDRSAQSDAL